MVLKALALSGFAVLFSAGALLAGIVAAGGHAADTTTTEQTTITETAPERPRPWSRRRPGG